MADHTDAMLPHLAARDVTMMAVSRAPLAEIEAFKKRMPVSDLVSNWAYMVIAALAWNLKAWYGLLVPDRERGIELVKMEFRRFLHAIMLLPCQVVRTARRVIYRIPGYNTWLKDFFATWQRLEAFYTGYPAESGIKRQPKNPAYAEGDRNQQDRHGSKSEPSFPGRRCPVIEDVNRPEGTSFRI